MDCAQQDARFRVKVGVAAESVGEFLTQYDLRSTPGGKFIEKADKKMSTAMYLLGTSEGPGESE